MIHESGIEYCLVAEYANGDKFCLAKFMHEEDARNYKRSRRKKDYVEYRLYRRSQKYNGEVIWEES
jgi:hypothetical protein